MMPLPQTVISGDTLKERWNISSAGILFMLMNHDLNTATGNEYPFIVEKADECEALWLIIEDKFDPSGFLYWFDDVIRVQTEYPELRSNDKIVYTVSELEMRWQLSDTEVFDIIENTGLHPVDPVGIELDSELLDRLIIEHKCIKPQDFLYRRSDIEKAELEFDIEHSDEEQQEVPIPDDKDAESEAGIPVFSFFRNGDRWKIGIAGKEKDLNHLKGFDLIRLLIQHENQEIDSTLLDNLCKMSVPDEAVDKNRGLRLEGSFQDEIIDMETIISIKEQIELFDEQIECEQDQEERLILKDKKAELQEYLSNSSTRNCKVKKRKNSEQQNRRTNVQKLIKKALSNVEAQGPEIHMYLNHKTIKTGSTCSYRPDPSKPVSWKLYPTE